MENDILFFEYNGAKYAYNSSRLFELIVKPTNEEIDDTQLTIQESYVSNIEGDGDETKASKEVVETRSSINKDLMNIKYNFYRTCIDEFFDAGYDTNGIIKEFDIKDLSLRQIMAFNTLLSEGIIYAID